MADDVQFSESFEYIMHPKVLSPFPLLTVCVCKGSGFWVTSYWWFMEHELDNQIRQRERQKVGKEERCRCRWEVGGKPRPARVPIERRAACCPRATARPRPCPATSDAHDRLMPPRARRAEIHRAGQRAGRPICASVCVFSNVIQKLVHFVTQLINYCINDFCP